MNALKVLSFIKRQTVYRIPQEIHVEAIVNDVAYAKLLSFVKRHPSVMCMLTGPNERWIRVKISADRVKDEEYAALLKERYVHLARFCNVGLHSHIHHKRSLFPLSYLEQYNQLLSALSFFKSLGLNLVDFSPGWWSYDHNTLRVCEKLGIERFHVTTGQQVSGGLKFVRVHNWSHDYDLK